MLERYIVRGECQNGTDLLLLKTDSLDRATELVERLGPAKDADGEYLYTDLEIYEQMQKRGRA